MESATRTRAVVGVALTATLLVLTACDPVMGTSSGPVRHATLTSSSHMAYHYAGTRDVVYAQPGTPSSDTNVREVFWYADAKFRADQQICLTWNTVATVDSGGLLQPGVAMRIAPATSDNKGVEAVTLTQNTFFGALWLFNVHVWNSLDRNHPFTQVAQFDLSPIVGTLIGGELASPEMVPAPWHVCARTAGLTFSFMVWTGNNPKPSWGDRTHVFTTRLPAGWDQPGYAGAYMAHLHPNQAAAVSAVTTGAPE